MDEREPEHPPGHRNLPTRPPHTGRNSHFAYAIPAEWRDNLPNEWPVNQDLVEYWRILWLKKFFILRCALLALLLALSLSLLQRPVYRARTSIAIQDLNENFLNLKEDPTAFNPAGPAESYFQTQVQILQSESLLQRVIEKPPIAQALAQEQRRHRMLHWRKYLGLPEPVPSRSPQRIIENVASQLTVRAFGETRLVQVYFESDDPKFAAGFANTLVDEFVDQSHQMRWESTQRTAEWLAAHLTEMKTNLENGETELQRYARDSDLLFSDKGNVTEEKLLQLQQEYSKAQVDRAQKQSKYETAITKPLESLPEVLDDPTVRELGLKLAQLQQQKAQLTSALTPEHYKVREVQAQIDELTSELERQRQSMVQRAANEYLSARRHEELLAKQYELQAKTVSDQAQKAIHYDTLKHEVDSSRQLYVALLQRVKQAGLAAAMQASNILVVDKAKTPLLPYSPSYPLNSTLGLFLGTLFGAGLSILRERFNRLVVSPGVASACLNLPELGAIPLVAIPSRPRRFFPDPHRSANATQGSTQSDKNESEPLKISPSEGGAVARSELLMIAEAFRATLTSILLPAFDGPAPRVVVVSSFGPRAGKTTVTCNLGIAMAQTGRKVLLVDADRGRPNLHRVFKLSNSWGLCDVLRSDHPIKSSNLEPIVRHTDVDGLDLLPNGTTREDSSWLLYSPRFSALLLQVRQDYDLVLIDTPPMVLFADARVLGRMADAAVLVIRAGQTTLEEAQRAVQRFAADGTHVLGTVLNSWNRKANGGTDYAYYKEYVGQS
jgi:polysaccharide biosynthesis transport protein